MNTSTMTKSQLAALVAQLTNTNEADETPYDVKPEAKAKGKTKPASSIDASYIANGKVQSIKLVASNITPEAIEAALNGSSSIDEALTYALLSGADMPITSKDFLKSAREIHTASNNPAPFNKDKIPAYKFVQIAERIRKDHSEPLLEQWNEFVISVDAENTAKRKEAEKADKKPSLKRVVPPSINGLARLVRGEAEPVHFMTKAVAFLQKAIETIDTNENLSKAEQAFHGKLRHFTAN